MQLSHIVSPEQSEPLLLSNKALINNVQYDTKTNSCIPNSNQSAPINLHEKSNFDPMITNNHLYKWICVSTHYNSPKSSQKVPREQIRLSNKSIQKVDPSASHMIFDKVKNTRANILRANRNIKDKLNHCKDTVKYQSYNRSASNIK